ncbi:MAG TPA: hypothetical protein VK750_04090 [Cytophagaceae bacterium]|jgi:hypothetical protein|nr:hypothetical protein [Cytophagaceae bacterium]
MKTQFITDEKGNKVSVVLPIRQYQKMIEELEELEDIKLYDEAKAVKGKNVPFNEYLKKRSLKKK